MPRFRFDKLVRDKIVDHQLKAGARPKYRRLDKNDHREELIKKIIEEAREVLTAGEASLASEIADVQQAVDDLIEQFNLTEEDIKVSKEKKRQKTGPLKKASMSIMLI